MSDEAHDDMTRDEAEKAASNLSGGDWTLYLFDVIGDLDPLWVGVGYQRSDDTQVLGHGPTYRAAYDDAVRQIEETKN